LPFFGFLDQTILIMRQKTRSERVCEKYGQTPSAVYMGHGRRQECSSAPVPHVISVRRLPETTGVLDQNLDHATPATALVAFPARQRSVQRKDASQDHEGETSGRVISREDRPTSPVIERPLSARSDVLFYRQFSARQITNRRVEIARSTCHPVIRNTTPSASPTPNWELLYASAVMTM